MTIVGDIEKKDRDLAPNGERSEATVIEGGAFPGVYAESPDGADSPLSHDLHRWLTTAEGLTTPDWPELDEVERINAGITEIGLGLLLLVTLIGFAIICWHL